MSKLDVFPHSPMRESAHPGIRDGIDRSLWPVSVRGRQTQVRNWSGTGEYGWLRLGAELAGWTDVRLPLVEVLELGRSGVGARGGLLNGRDGRRLDTPPVIASADTRTAATMTAAATAGQRRKHFGGGMWLSCFG